MPLPLRSPFHTALLCLILSLISTGMLYAQGAPTPPPASMDTEALTIDAARYRFIGNLDKAASIYRQILEKYPTHALAAFELARILVDKNELEAALGFAKTATTNEPLNKWYQQLLAQIYQRLDQFDRAAQVFEELAHSFPSELSFYIDWAAMYKKAGLLSNALKVYEQAETQFGILQNLSIPQYNVYMELGDVKKAGRTLERLCSAFPGNNTYLHQLATFYEKQQNSTEAQATYQRILQTDSTDAKALAALATSSPLQNADDALTTLIQNKNIPPSLKIEKIQLLLPPVRGDQRVSPSAPPISRLLAATQLLDQLHPGRADVNALLAELLRLDNQPTAALEKWRYALQLDETNFQYWEKTLRLLENLGNIPQLYRQSANALDIFPNKPLLYYFQALACYNQQNIPTATSNINQALLMGSTDSDLQVEILSLQALLLQASNPTASAEALAKAVGIQKNHPMLLARQASLLLQTNQLQDAANLAHQVLNTPALREATVVLASAAYARQQWQNVSELLQSIPCSEDPRCLELLGDSAFQAGQPEQALVLWNKAREKGNKSPQLLKKITDKQL